VDAVGCLVVANAVDGFGGVRIDEPKGHVFNEEFIFKLLNLRDIAVGDGAVCREEEDDNGRGSGIGQLGDGFAVEVVSVNHRRLSAGECREGGRAPQEYENDDCSSHRFQ